MATVERARPLLGTVVSVRLEAEPSAAHAHIDAVFEDVALIERLMSFQRPDSELSALNQRAHQRAVRVHAHTWRVLHWSRRLSRLSQGGFDVSINARDPERAGDWRDLQLLPQRQVRFRRALKLDLSGIAKGYAVDLAMTRLRSRGVTDAVVNAGGDLRVMGRGCERIALRAQAASLPDAMIELSNGALATSAAPGLATVSVAARRCLIADAMTKIVIANGASASPLLALFGARAWRHQAGGSWQALQ